jgi:hypothetical protein
LWLRHEQEAVDQLDAIAVLEHTLVDESLVLDALPSLHLECRSRH